MAGRWVGRFGHLWSLAVEQQFYLLAAPVLILIPSRWARGACLAALALAGTCALVMLATGADAMARYTNSLVNFGPMALGGWLALGRSEHPEEGKAWLPTAVPLALLVVLPVLVWKLSALAVMPGPVLETAALFTGTLAAGLLIRGLYRNQAERLGMLDASPK